MWWWWSGGVGDTCHLSKFVVFKKKCILIVPNWNKLLFEKSLPKFQDFAWHENPTSYPRWPIWPMLFPHTRGKGLQLWFGSLLEFIGRCKPFQFDASALFSVCRNYVTHYRVRGGTGDGKNTRHCLALGEHCWGNTGVNKRRTKRVLLNPVLCLVD